MLVIVVSIGRFLPFVLDKKSKAGHTGFRVDLPDSVQRPAVPAYPVRRQLAGKEQGHEGEHFQQEGSPVGIAVKSVSGAWHKLFQNSGLPPAPNALAPFMLFDRHKHPFHFSCSVSRVTLR